MKKRILSLTLVVVMLIAALPFSAMSALAAEYTDIAGSWAQEAILRWSDRGIIQGSDGKFLPKEHITRADMAVILDRIMGYQQAAGNSFTDLPNAYYTNAILKANSAGIIRGSGNLVRPMDKITREEAAVMMGRAFGIAESTTQAAFSDYAKISTWAVGYVNALAERGIMQGFDGKFLPKSNISRAEVVAVLDKSIQGLYQKSGTYTEDVSGSVVIKCPDVTLKDMSILGDLIVSEGVGNGTVTLDNVTIGGDTILRGGGEHSVIFNQVTVNGGVVVSKQDGKIRVVATGSTCVSVKLTNGAIIINDGKGGFDNVVINEEVGSLQSVVLEGNFKEVVNNAADANIEATGKIETLTTRAAATISGDVKIDQTVAPQGKEISIKINGEEVKVTDKPSNPADATKPNKPSGGGGGGSSSTSQSDLDNEAAKYVTAVTIPKTVGEGTDITSLVTVLKVGRTADSSISITPSVADAQDPYHYLRAKSGTVTLLRQAATTDATAAVTLTFSKNGYTAQCEVRVTIAKTVDVDYDIGGAENIDERFVEGYPKLEVRNNSETGKDYLAILVKLRGNVTADDPVEVYSVLDDMYMRASSEDVIHGHPSGLPGAPGGCLRVEDGAEHTFTMDSSYTSPSIKIYLVIKQGENISAQPTTITLNPEFVAEASKPQAPSTLGSGFVNTARTRIALPFIGVIDPNSDDCVKAFSVEGGAVSDVEVDINTSMYSGMCTVYLTVDGLTASEGSSADYDFYQVTYTMPELGGLRDAATGTALVKSFTVPVRTCRTMETTAYLSDDGKYLLYHEGEDPVVPYLFQGTSQSAESSAWLYNADTDEKTRLVGVEYSETRSTYGLILNEPLDTQTAKVLVLQHEPLPVDNPTEDLTGREVFDITGDRWDGQVEYRTIQLVTERQSAVSTFYNSEQQTIWLEMAVGGRRSWTIPPCYFTLTVNGSDYRLRSPISPSRAQTGRDLRIMPILLQGSFAPALQPGDVVTLSYHVDPEENIHPLHQLYDLAGRPTPDFSISVVIPGTQQ